VITDHLVDKRSPAIVRLQRELSAANERLLVAASRPKVGGANDPIQAFVPQPNLV
jgi:hypothetical protein